MTKYEVKDIYGRLYTVSDEHTTLVGDVEKDNIITSVDKSGRAIKIWSHRAKKLINDMGLKLSYGVGAGIGENTFKVIPVYGVAANALSILPILDNDKTVIENQIKHNIQLAKLDMAQGEKAILKSLDSLEVIKNNPKFNKSVKPANNKTKLFTYVDKRSGRVKMLLKYIIVGLENGVPTLYHDTPSDVFVPLTKDQLTKFYNKIKPRVGYIYNTLTHIITPMEYLVNIKGISKPMTWYITSDRKIVKIEHHHELYWNKQVVIDRLVSDISAIEKINKETKRRYNETKRRYNEI